MHRTRPSRFKSDAGFTAGTPWLKLGPACKTINRAADRAAPDSVFAYYQALIRLRREHPAVIEGDLRFLSQSSPNVLLWLRRCEAETMLVIANYSGETVPAAFPREVSGKTWTRVLTNRPGTEPSVSAGRPWLPWEAEVYVLA